MAESTNEETKVTSEPDVKDNQVPKTEENKPKKRGRPPKIKDDKASENKKSKNKDGKAKDEEPKIKRDDIVQTAVTYMLEDLDKYFRDPTSNQVSKESIQYYIQRCCNLYINYSVIDKVITMTGLKDRICDQDEYLGLRLVIKWAKDFTLYHIILESNKETYIKEKDQYVVRKIHEVAATDVDASNAGLAYNKAYEATKIVSEKYGKAIMDSIEKAVESIADVKKIAEEFDKKITQNIQTTIDEVINTISRFDDIVKVSVDKHTKVETSAAEAAIAAITGIEKVIIAGYNTAIELGVRDAEKIITHTVAGIIYDAVMDAIANTPYTIQAAIDDGVPKEVIFSRESVIANAAAITAEEAVNNTKNNIKNDNKNVEKAVNVDDINGIVDGSTWDVFTSNLLNLLSLGVFDDQDVSEHDDNNEGNTEQVSYNKFIQVLNGERQINLGIHGDPINAKELDYINIETDLYMTQEAFLEKLETNKDDETNTTFGINYGLNSDVEEQFVEANLGNGIGQYKYNANLKDDPADFIFKYLINSDKEQQNDIKNNIHSALKTVMYGGSGVSDLNTLNFSPLGINPSITFHFLIHNNSMKHTWERLKYNRIAKRIGKINGELTEEEIKRVKKIEKDANDEKDVKLKKIKKYAEEAENYILEIIEEIWNVSFNPISALGLINDDNDGDVQNYSWRQNVYSLENIIGSVLDEMGRFNNNFYDTDTYKHRDPQFVGYYEGMFDNVGRLHENKRNKKQDPSQKITRNNSKGNSKDYIFLYDGINDPAKYTKYTTPIEGSDHDLYGEEIELPDTLKIVLPLCIDLMESELVEMIQALSLYYPHPIIGLEGMVDYLDIITLRKQNTITRRSKK